MRSTSRLSHRSVRSLLNFALAFAAVALITGAWTARAQEATDPQTSSAVFAEPPLPPLPAAGGKFRDPVFGTEIMRVTDARDGAQNGTFYPHWPTFNADDFLWQMSMSADNDIFAFTHKGNEGLIGYTVYKRSTDSVLLDVRSTREDEVRIDKTGRYLGLFMTAVGSDGFDCAILDIQTGTRI